MSAYISMGLRCLPPRRLGTRAAGVAVATTTVTSTAAAAAVTTTSVASGATEAAATAAAVAGTLGRSVEAASTTAVAAEAAAAELSEVTVGIAATTTTTARTATTATSTERRLTSDGLEECWDLLVSFLEQVHELTDDSAVASVKECGRNTGVSGTTSTTNSVNIVVNIGRKIVVDNMQNVGNIQT